ncbi:hypothetical protein BGX24_000856, partial [Mortierella sp. AD032]
MRLSAVAIAASLVAVANAQSAYFPHPPEAACVAACTDRIGKAMFPEYNDIDEYGPHFIESLSYSYEIGSPNTLKFVPEVGKCFVACTGAELGKYGMQYSAKKAWYDLNKNSTPPPRPSVTIAPPTPTITTTTATTTTTTTTTSGPISTIPTGPVTPPSGGFVYNFEPNGPCVSTCTNRFGKKMFPNYSEDP